MPAVFEAGEHSLNNVQGYLYIAPRAARNENNEPADEMIQRRVSTETQQIVQRDAHRMRNALDAREWRIEHSTLEAADRLGLHSNPLRQSGLRHPKQLALRCYTLSESLRKLAHQITSSSQRTT